MFLYLRSLRKLINECTQNELSTERDSRVREAEVYQQKVKEKEEKIADLTDKLQALEARINQLREQAESQPTLPTDPLDKAVMEVVDLRGELADAEDEKQKAYSHMLEAKQWIKIASENVSHVVLV